MVMEGLYPGEGRRVSCCILVKECLYPGEGRLYLGEGRLVSR